MGLIWRVFKEEVYGITTVSPNASLDGPAVRGATTPELSGSVVRPTE